MSANFAQLSARSLSKGREMTLPESDHLSATVSSRTQDPGVVSVRSMQVGRPRDDPSSDTKHRITSAGVGTAAKLLSKCEGVRSFGDGRWVARCPAHEDRRPSLSVREVSDGRVLVHCFSGCSVYQVVAAVGLELSDLFPPRDPGYCRPIRKPWSPAQMLHLLDREAIVELVLVADLVNQRRATEWDRKRLVLARSRLARIMKELPAP
jgi:hypothetical protein